MTATKIEKRPDRFAEGLEILTDLSRTEIGAVAAYLVKTRGLKDANRAFGLHVGALLRGVKMDRAMDEHALHRWADDGGPA